MNKIKIVITIVWFFAIGWVGLFIGFLMGPKIWETRVKNLPKFLRIIVLGPLSNSLIRKYKQTGPAI